MMIDHHHYIDTKTAQPRPARRLKKIFCPRHKVQDEHELAISPPIMDSVYSPLASPTNLKNHGPSPYHHQPLVLNSVPPRISSMPKRTTTLPATSSPSHHHSSLPRPPRKPISRARPSAEQDRRHSFHLPPSNISSTSVRTAPPATTTAATPNASRLADLGNKANKRQSRAAASVASATVVPVKSRSTPMRVKTYNVNYNPEAEMERVRKQKELEELIAGGRRGSTLKLSLTPRGL